MLSEYFGQYLRVYKKLSESTVGHYIQGIRTIDRYLIKYNQSVKSVYDVKSKEELKNIEIFLLNNSEFIKQDDIGHKMYSNSFKRFVEFVDDDTSFAGTIKNMDIVVSAPQQITKTADVWRRNQIIVAQSIEGANYLCEHNNNHKTFTSKKTNHQYMEGHHLIPLKYQSQFNCSIDVYANVVCLCPICHRLLHYGTDSEKLYTAEELFEMRNDRLIKSGIDISRKEFTELIIG